MKGDVVAVFPDSAHKTPEAASGTRDGGGRLSGGFCENTEPSAVWNRTPASENGVRFCKGLPRCANTGQQANSQ